MVIYVIHGHAVPLILFKVLFELMPSCAIHVILLSFDFSDQLSKKSEEQGRVKNVFRGFLQKRCCWNQGNK
jgi:hypothetical protein